MRRSSALLVLLLVVAAAPQASAAPNDPAWPDQYGLHIVGAEEAWTRSRGAVKVAVVDTGVDLNHPDLQRNVVAGKNFVEDGQPPDDDHGHGTHVAGIVGAVTDNGRGVASVAPDVQIMPVRVLEKDPDDPNGARGSCSDIREGIRWAADNGAAVINLSLGGEIVVVPDVLGECMGDAPNYAWSHGAIPVIAAGNDSLPIASLRSLDAIVVSATNRHDGHAGYSNGTGNSKWGMAAPGSAIVSTWIDDEYAEASGTSMATPHVVGGAALLRAMGASKQGTVDTLLETAEDLGPSGQDTIFGHGRLDVAAATAALSSPPSENGGGGGSPGNPDGGSEGGEPRRSTGGSEDGGPTGRPASTSGSSPDDDATTSPTPDDGSEAEAASRDVPSPFAAPPPSDGDGGGGLLAPLLGLAGALVLSAAGLALWRWRGGW